MRQPLVAATGGDNGEARRARPVDEVADERGLVAVGQAVDNARLRRPAGEQRPAQRIGFDGDVDHVLALAERGHAVRDGGDRIAGAFDDDVDARVAQQRLPVVADMRRSVRKRSIDRACAAALGFPAHAGEIGLRRRRGQIGDGGNVHARRFGYLGEIHRAKLAGADQANGKGSALRGALAELGVKAHVGRGLQAASSDRSAAAGVPSRHGNGTS